MKLILAIIVSVLVLSGCTAKTERNPAKPNMKSHSMDSQSFLAKNNEIFKKMLCDSNVGLSCIGLGSDICLAQVTDYVTKCSELLNINLPDTPSAQALKQAGGALGKCVFQQRMASGQDLHLINLQSCKMLSQAGQKMQNKASKPL